MAKNGILAKCEDLYQSFSTANEQVTIGIDLGDRFSYCCVLASDGTLLTEGRVVSTPEAMARHFQDLPPTRFAFEVGSHSRWVFFSEQVSLLTIESLGTMARWWSAFPVFPDTRPSDQIVAWSKKDLHAVHAKLQEVLSELSKAKGGGTRRRLLVAMRELLAEADRLTSALAAEE